MSKNTWFWHEATLPHFGEKSIVISACSPPKLCLFVFVWFCRATYSNFPPEGVLANVLGILLVVFGVLLGYLITKDEYRRPPNPEEEALSVHFKTLTEGQSPASPWPAWEGVTLVCRWRFGVSVCPKRSPRNHHHLSIHFVVNVSFNRTANTYVALRCSLIVRGQSLQLCDDRPSNSRCNE